MFNPRRWNPPRPSDTKSGEYFWEHRMYIPCKFGVDRPTRFRDMDYAIFPHWPQCKMKIQPPTPGAPMGRSSPNYLVPVPGVCSTLSQNFTPIAPSCVEISSTVQTNKNKKSKLNITPNATLYGEIITSNVEYFLPIILLKVVFCLHHWNHHDFVNKCRCLKHECHFST